MSAQPGSGNDSQASATAYGFADRWLADAMRLRLQTAKPVAALAPARVDAAAAAARQHSKDPEARVLFWAKTLATDTGLTEAQHAWRQRGRLILSGLLLLGFAGGLSAALGVMGSGSAPVNVLWALGALLGINLLMLLFWIISLFMAPGALSAGRLWFWLNARFFGRASIVLAQSFNSLNQRAGLTRWWLSSITHAFWTAALAGSLTGLLLALSLRSYAFVWETTILPASVFAAVVQLLGWLPSMLGFSLPDHDTVVNAGRMVSDALLQTDAERRVWAGWLCGAVVVYGLLPRVLLLAFSLWRVKTGQGAIRLDLHSADWAGISQKLSPPSEIAGVTDPAPVLTKTGQLQRHTIAAGSAAPLVVGFELDEQMQWPALPAGVQHLMASSREQRQAVISQLDQSPPSALLLVCDSAQTVDRGSLAWMYEASGRVLHVAAWLSGNGSDSRREQWREHLLTLGIASEQIFEEPQAAMAWLEDFL